MKNKKKLQEDYNKIPIMRYMGTKINLLDFVIPEIIKLVEEGDTILDIMAGTQSVGYALKFRQKILSNDIQEFSYLIGKALIENNQASISKNEAIKDLEVNFNFNLKNKLFYLFENLYADTYFSKKQCKEIDSIRFAISKITNKYKKALYLTSLIYTMCYAQSTTGHFAQYLKKTHYRVKPLRKIKIWKTFLKKCDNLKVKFNEFENKSYCKSYKEFFSKEFSELMSDVNLIYLDPPYTDAQYSRFYHILETMIKYDYPEIDFIGRYRQDRFKSNFCYKPKVKEEFEFILKNISKYSHIKLVISYSSKGLISKEDLKKLCKKYFNSVNLITKDYSHSTQGKGISKVEEILFICKN